MGESRGRGSDFTISRTSGRSVAGNQPSTPAEAPNRAGDPTGRGGVRPLDSSLEQEVLPEPDARAHDNCLRIVRPVLEWYSDHAARARPAHQVLEVVQIGLGAAIPFSAAVHWPVAVGAAMGAASQ
jgi:hypothetical protein